MKNIKIIVATHKKYQMPEDEVYLPLQVGKEGKESLGYEEDNKGDNISSLNPYFCELTGLYWAWKNLNSDYIGLVHYRRHFSNSNIIPITEEKRFKHILSKNKIEKLLDKTDIILPKKRRYFIENIYAHYKHTMNIETLDEAGKILEEKYPEYMPEFKKLHKRTSAHLFNMFIMKKEILDEYCEWLFDILFELEKRIDITQYDSFHSRYLGRVSERLLDVWINTNKLKYLEITAMNMQKINWIKKGISFLIAKFIGKKYTKSF